MGLTKTLLCKDNPLLDVWREWNKNLDFLMSVDGSGINSFHCLSKSCLRKVNYSNWMKECKPASQTPGWSMKRPKNYLRKLQVAMWQRVCAQHASKGTGRKEPAEGVAVAGGAHVEGKHSYLCKPTFWYEKHLETTDGHAKGIFQLDRVQKLSGG